MNRNRIGLSVVASAVFLGAGIATFSKAQQPPAAPARPGEERVSREKHAALRAEVDLLQLRYNAASTVLQEALKRTEELELMRKGGDYKPIVIYARYMEVVTGKVESGDQLLRAAALLGEPANPKEFDVGAEQDVKRVEQSWKTALEAKQKAFLQLSTTLHEKSLELSIYEKQHEESR